MKIKDYAVEQRPRERLRENGSDALSEAELLSILLQSGSKNESAVELSNRLLGTFGLGRLKNLSLQELTKVKGIGTAKASTILAAFELSKRVNSGRICEKVVSCPSDIALHYLERMRGLEKEHLIGVFLDSKNKIIKDEIISIGTLNSSLIHPREVFKEAIRNSANAVILVHNHPSGDCSPSDEDRRVTAALKEAGKLVGIEVLDHIVVGREGWARCQE